ncbi:recombinase RecF [Leifsonia sp. Root227]|uniref:DNA replication/repair protein RecF n=1 Tax=unclassified Leifsonia TaxID=2663824 RepID=UPI0007021DC3|nr:DNA replication/repair protein RecF [Leifsonia sp. Root227]KRC46845.1 recombinase RecF [Leifsonia sp. Root227]
MRVTHLSLTDFRNYRTAEVPLAAGANLFVGRNGQGKTNLVESLGYLSTLGSHRVSSDQAMIRKDAESAVVRTRIQHDGRELLVELQLNRGSANRAQVNRSAIKTRELPRYFSSVLFAPEDLALVRGEPSIRRRFVDQLLVQRNPRFAGVLADYERVLKQRNTLLKSARASGVKDGQLGTLDIWDERLVALGAELVDARLDLIARLTDPLTNAYRSVAGDDHHPRLIPLLTIRGAEVEDTDDAGSADSVTDSSGVATTDAFRQALASVRRKELDRGLTLIGPHRDDVLFELNGLPAKGYASHGESWSFALALKLASAELLRRESNTGDPVLILDDVFAELDQARRRMLATAVGGYEQVLITAAVFDDVPGELTAHTVRIEAGAVVDESAENGTEKGAVDG